MPRRTKSYYAVYRGRQPGVYATWEQCQAQVKGFSGAQYKKFGTLSDAENYVQTGSFTEISPGGITTVNPPSSPLTLTDSDLIHIYTDGSCLGNGTPQARAGYGVWFGPDDPRNVSCRLSGRQTNNRAELTAILTATRILTDQLQSGRSVVIHTDSEYSRNCLGQYGRRMAENDWQGSDNRPIPNLDLVREGVSVFTHYPNLQLAYVKAHTGATDPHSLGNAMADQLAVAGANLPS